MLKWEEKTHYTFSMAYISLHNRWSWDRYWATYQYGFCI